MVAKIFDGAKWFHFTGITPALSDTLAGIVLKAVRIAKEKGITVSCDLNFRKKLWSKEKAKEVMSEICKYVDVCIANEEDAKDVFGIEAIIKPCGLGHSKARDISACMKILKEE